MLMFIIEGSESQKYIDPKLVCEFVKDKISSINEYKNYSSCELKHMVGVLVLSL